MEILQKHIEVHTGVAVAVQKLVCAHLNFAANNLNDSGIVNGTKILLIERNITDAQALREASMKQAKFERNRLEFQQKYQLKPTTDKESISVVKFLKFEVLQSFPDKDKAMSILHKLAQDAGIKHVMIKYQWSVGLLKEIHPNEQSTILGFNQNKGQVIALRLRTDNLEGFRAYDMLRKVLIHELAHMFENYLFLMQGLLTQQVHESDWTRTGNKIAEAGSFPTESESKASAFKATGHVLGGKASSQDMRHLMYKSAVLRLTSEEEEITGGCQQE